MKIVAFLLIAIISCNQPITSSTPLHKFQKFILTPDILIKYAPEPPDYPQEAKSARIQGDVIVQISISPDGVPTSVVAVEGPEPLRPTAIIYFYQWRFSTITKGGPSQPPTVYVRMPFRLR